MSDAFILTGARTGRGKGSSKGALHATPPVRLVAGLLGVLRPRLAGGTVDDVILGCATQINDQGANLARSATLLAGWEPSVPALTINRFCASGLEAIALAASRVRAGDARLVIAGGVESVSRVPTFGDRGPLYADPDVMAAAGTIHMGVAADLVATLEGIEREACDAYGHATREKARKAPRSPSIVTFEGATLDHDENVGYQPSLDELAALPALFADRPAEDAVALARYPQLAALRHVHTRGSSPSLADAAALVAVGDLATAERTGLAPRARIVATASCAADPVTMLTAGQLAIEQALAKAGLRPADIAPVRVRRGIRCPLCTTHARPRRRPRSPQSEWRDHRARACLRGDGGDSDAECRRRARPSGRPLCGRRCQRCSGAGDCGGHRTNLTADRG